MRWLPGRRLGVIALSNITYAPMTELTCDAARPAARAGRGDRRCADRSPPQVRAAAERLVALLNGWDDAAADALFTDNVAWDDAYERRRAAVAGLVPLSLARVAAINDARGEGRCRAADGSDGDDHLQPRHRPPRPSPGLRHHHPMTPSRPVPGRLVAGRLVASRLVASRLVASRLVAAPGLRQSGRLPVASLVLPWSL